MCEPVNAYRLNGLDPATSRFEVESGSRGCPCSRSCVRRVRGVQFLKRLSARRLARMIASNYRQLDGAFLALHVVRCLARRVATSSLAQFLGMSGRISKRFFRRASSFDARRVEPAFVARIGSTSMCVGSSAIARRRAGFALRSPRENIDCNARESFARETTHARAALARRTTSRAVNVHDDREGSEPNLAAARSVRRVRDGLDTLHATSCAERCCAHRIGGRRDGSSQRRDGGGVASQRYVAIASRDRCVMKFLACDDHLKRPIRAMRGVTRDDARDAHRNAHGDRSRVGAASRIAMCAAMCAVCIDSRCRAAYAWQRGLLSDEIRAF